MGPAYSASRIMADVARCVNVCRMFNLHRYGHIHRCFYRFGVVYLLTLFLYSCASILVIMGQKCCVVVCRTFAWWLWALNVNIVCHCWVQFLDCSLRYSIVFKVRGIISPYCFKNCLPYWYHAFLCICYAAMNNCRSGSESIMQLFFQGNLRWRINMVLHFR